MQSTGKEKFTVYVYCKTRKYDPNEEGNEKAWESSSDDSSSESDSDSSDSNSSQSSSEDEQIDLKKPSSNFGKRNSL